MKETKINNEYFLVTYYIKEGILAYKFLKFVPSDIYRENMVNIRDFFIKKNLRKLMPVLTEAKVIAKEDQKWFAEEIIQKMAETSLKYVGIIPPKDVFGSSSSQNIISTLEKSNDGVLRKEFKTEEQAMEWFNSI